MGNEMRVQRAHIYLTNCFNNQVPEAIALDTLSSAFGFEKRFYDNHMETIIRADKAREAALQQKREQKVVEQMPDDLRQS